MSNIIDYIDWRGDVDFKASPFNSVDNLILCQLSYLNFLGIVQENFQETITLRDVAHAFSELPTEKENDRTYLGPLINKDTFLLLQKAGLSNRFGNIKLCGFIAQLDSIKEKQFSAITFIIDKKLSFIAFRGTDATITGWKEDFNMAFMSPVPAQLESIKYIDNAATKLNGNIITGGHSKGGNLAIYSVAFCNPKTRKHIIGIYNNDGPGFSKTTMNDERFILITPLIHSYIPQSSVVGMLFEHEDSCTIIESSESNGILQHDPFSWLVKGCSFLHLPELTKDSIFLDRTVKDWLQQMTKEQRELFIDTMFNILEATKAQNLTDLTDNWARNTGIILKSLKEIDSDTRNAVIQTFFMLIKAAKKNIPSSFFKISDFLK